MIPLNIELETDFLKDEIRCDYLVNGKMKEVWVVELELLNKFISVCNKYDIRYFVMGGTLLGTVRHKGYIPWDDDIDVLMSRQEYRKLCSIAEKEFQYPYFFQTDETDFGFARPFARLRNSLTTGIQKFEVGAKIPYNQGIFIDIFPYDNIPDDLMERKKYIKSLCKLHSKAWRLSTWTIRYIKGNTIGVKGLVKDIISPILRYFFIRYKISNPYWTRWEKEVQKYNNKPTKEIGLMYFYREDEFCIWDMKDLEECVVLPFEMLKVNVPIGYENMLTKSYGDWRKYVVGNNQHGDMYFDTTKSYKEYVDAHGVTMIIE